MPMPAPTIQDIIEKAKAYLPALGEDRIMHAYDFAQRAHGSQTRFSGEPYIIHPLNVADILLDFHPDENTILAALLHDVAEDTEKTLDDIENSFGRDVRELCSGMVKLSKVHSKLNDPQIENLRKLFLVMARDFRVVLLKLCDRLHNMRTIEFVHPEKRTRIAQETLNIFAPIASRLGIYLLKSQLEDLCFKQLNPDQYLDIQNQLAKTEKWRGNYIDTAKKILLDTLSTEGICARVDGRVKSVYSIYRKLKKKTKTSIEEVFDVFAMRVVLPDIYKYGKEYNGHLYTALGVIHNHFTPLANRFKDYVAVPKVNGYRSLHTTVMGLGPKIHAQPTEIQLRTETIHQSAEFGIAAHWLYEEGIEFVKSGQRPVNSDEAAAYSIAPFLQQQKDWISNLSTIEKEIGSNQEFLETLKVDVFHDRIFVLTPRGDIKDLPSGATPVDFAYAIHSEIGNHCMGAKVNGNMVPLDYELKNGEVVEVLTRNNIKPNQQWLSFVKTNYARNRIRSWLKGLDEEKHLRAGKTLLNEKLRQLGKPVLDTNFTLLNKYNGEHLSLPQRHSLLVEIGKGAQLPGTVLRKLFTLEELLMNRTNRGGIAKKQDNEEKPKVIIGSETDMPYQFVQCCNADFGDDLIGYITRGRGISLHRKDCPVLRSSESSRLIDVDVKQGSACWYPVRIKVEAHDRIGLVRDLSQIMAENSVNIIDLRQTPTKDNHPEWTFLVQIEQFDQLEKVLSKLEKIPSVLRARKAN